MKGIVINGGEIWINSSQEHGSTFCFSIPL
jgi:signal transduction histidine kinase